MKKFIKTISSFSLLALALNAFGAGSDQRKVDAGFIEFKKGSVSTPSAGYSRVYVKTDGKPYISSSAGTETEIVTSSAGGFWGISGTGGSTAGTNFIGTTDAVDFVIKTNNIERLRVTASGQYKTNLAAGVMKVSGSAGYVSTSAIDLANSTDAVGVLGVPNGGLGLSSLPSNGQLAIGNGSGFTEATLTGTSNQISVANSAGGITLSTPQNIGTGSVPKFSNVTLSALLTGVVQASNGVITSSALAHSALSGLSADDHSQYALLAGRSPGGQTFNGGSGASENVTISSTSNGTKGKVTIGQSYFEGASGRIGLFTSATEPSSPDAFLIKSGASTGQGLVLEGPTGAVNSGTKWIIYGDDSQLDIAKKGLSEGNITVTNQERIIFGDGASSYKVGLNKTSTNTAISSLSASDPILGMRNASATGGNFTGIVSENQGVVPGTGIFSVHDAHGAGGSSHLELWTRNSGTFANRVTVSSAGIVTMSAYGAGIAHFGANGQISSSNVNAPTELTGAVSATNGGTGQSTYSAGEILIANSGGGLTRTSLTAGNNITIITGSASITISGSAGGSGGGLSGIGTYDSQTPNANGLVSSSAQIFAQSATTAVPGMVSTSAQNFAGEKRFSNPIGLGEVATPVTPSSGFGKIYFKADHNAYVMDSTGAEKQISGAGTSNQVDWKNDQTFTPSGFGTVSATNYWYRREGDTMIVRGNFTNGTVAASTGLIQLPTGFTIDTSKFSSATSVQLVGMATALRSSSNNLYTGTFASMLFYDGSTNNQVFFAQTSASNIFVKANGSGLFGTGDVITFEFKIPITGWTSGGAASPNCEIRYASGNGHDATNTKVRLWTTRRVTPSAACMADTATTNGKITISSSALYCMNYFDERAAAACSFGIVQNPTAGTTSIVSVTDTQGKRSMGNSALLGSSGSTSWCGNLSANDVISFQDDGNCDSTDATSGFTINRMTF